MIKTALQKRLFEMQDMSYRRFQQKLLPTVSRETIIGIRTPVLRSFAKEFAKTPDAKKFIKKLPHVYYEENNVHAFIIETIADFDTAVAALDAFLPYVDNWATCDSMSPKALEKNIPALYKKIREWIASSKTYTVRFGIGMLMRFFLDEHFTLSSASLVSKIRSGEYYINMMIAWYFATALAKQYDAVLPFIEKKKLDTWTHNKTIQKAIESYRISDECKNYLRGLKRKS
ncbi:DNA alkylation repair protein [Treponema socranskii]|uniref:DNA alkylation repair protein n=1 Tax=Treponema socranskii TaxID=53419 RepID=UPI002870FCC1|nr:DNA alkylation repair protein [Treponema socranskii]MDR9858217.1 DNA alkylation repair protein [Treponema socranskii]